MSDTPTTTTNPLLGAIKLPGKRFRLPSHGRFYTNDEISDTVVDGEIEVTSTTTIDEIALRSADFLMSGEAIERVFMRCIPEVKKPLELLAKDVDFLLGALRIVSYGDEFPIKPSCPICEQKFNFARDAELAELYAHVKTKAAEDGYDFDDAIGSPDVVKKIDEITKRVAPRQEHIVPLATILANRTTEVDDGEHIKYTLTLTNGQVVKMIPPRMSSAVAIQQFKQLSDLTKIDAQEDFAAYIASCTVVQVDEITDRDLISEWAKKLPSAFKVQISERAEDMIVWGTDFTYSITCKEKSCGHEWDVSTLLNPVMFFMKPSE